MRITHLYRKELTDYLQQPLDGLTGEQRIIQHAVNKTVARVHQSMEAFIHNMNTIHSRGGNRWYSAPSTTVRILPPRDAASSANC